MVAHDRPRLPRSPRKSEQQLQEEEAQHQALVDLLQTVDDLIEEFGGTVDSSESEYSSSSEEDEPENLQEAIQQLLDYGEELLNDLGEEME